MSLDFVAVDVETANRFRGSICSFGLAVVENGRIVRTENWLTRPPEDLNYFDPFNVHLHGITPEMVAAEPSFEERLTQVIETVGELPIVAHNAAFDVGAIREGCDETDLPWPDLTYGCSLVLSRRILTMLSYKLPLVCRELGISLVNHHQAAADAAASAAITLVLAERQGTDSLEALAESVRVRLGEVNSDLWRGCVYRGPAGGHAGYGPIPDANADADPLHPFYGEVIVFTGALSVRREDAWAAVAKLGATPENSVTKRTTILVIGGGFVGDKVEDFHTGKAAKASRWLQKGKRIEVLDEQEFLFMLEDQASGSRVSE